MRLVLALTVLPTLPTVAAIDPCYLNQRVGDAATVIQVADHEVSGPDAGGACLLTGVVIRSFRGTKAVGTEVQTPFACANPDMLVGGTVYHGADSVAQAAAVELHLDADGAVAGYGQGLLPLDTVTKSPAFQAESATSC